MGLLFFLFLFFFFFGFFDLCFLFVCLFSVFVLFECCVLFPILTPFPSSQLSFPPKQERFTEVWLVPVKSAPRLRRRLLLRRRRSPLVAPRRGCCTTSDSSTRLRVLAVLRGPTPWPPVWRLKTRSSKFFFFFMINLIRNGLMGARKNPKK